ncbi:MAG TPA: helix-turn-helix transcriptional regulator [Anaerolineales bacterium]
MNESIGATLRAAREKRQLTLAQVSESTRVRAHYLQALENDDVSAMPSAAQARGFLRIYAQFLGLDLQTLIPPPAPAPVPVAMPTAVEDRSVPAPKIDLKATSLAFLIRLREWIVSRILRRGTSGSSDEAGASAAPDEAQDAEGKKKGLP